MRQTRILVVEDDHDLRRLFRLTLSMEGYLVDDVSDGIDALNSIDNHPPDLVVLDLHLLVLDGASVQQELAARAVTRDIPIVVVTGSDSHVTGSNVACLLRKPVNPDRLISVVRNCLARGSGAPA
jgi:DNA-binding response OmpR family regulator